MSVSSKGDYKAPQKTALYKPTPEIEQLREELLINPSFQNLQNKTLVDLQQNLTYTIENLIQQRKLTKAKKYQNLSIKIDKEARKRIANPALAPPTPMELPKNSKEGKKIAKFDSDTENKVEQMKKRHEIMIQNFQQLWENQIAGKCSTFFE